MDNSMSLESLLSMQGGDGDVSFDKNSFGAAAAIASSEQMLTSAIHSMELTQGVHIEIANLGLGDGGHTFSMVDTVVEVLRRKLAVINGGTEPELEVFFSDLRLSNRFFSSFRPLEDRVNDWGKKYYTYGTSLPFYMRLFPKGELHVVVTTSALQWLSLIPRKVMEKGSKTWNKGRVWIQGAEREVVEAYAEQSHKDLVEFLKCRKEEIVVGGMLFMLMAGRPSGLESQVSDDSRLKLIFTTLMDQAWQDLVDEGSIEEDRRDAFNIPLYLRNTEEVTAAIESCGGFKIEKMELLKIADPMNARQQEFIKDPDSYGRAMANLVQVAQIKPKVEAYLGPDLTSTFYERYAIGAANNKEFLTKNSFYSMIAVSAIRVWY
ncbi:gibberellic acid methyltransferase 1-like [Brassica napus]|uniref:gibberellic acid methyltransferase 1-like n=1 Tax=Brassica napus TaxID=3708 RepID=UPI00207ACA54|nr:gibberellic acid methyltransferase 1-like [Brassica napus]